MIISNATHLVRFPLEQMRIGNGKVTCIFHLHRSTVSNWYSRSESVGYDLSNSGDFIAYQSPWIDWLTVGSFRWGITWLSHFPHDLSPLWSTRDRHQIGETDDCSFRPHWQAWASRMLFEWYMTDFLGIILMIIQPLWRDHWATISDRNGTLIGI